MCKFCDSEPALICEDVVKATSIQVLVWLLAHAYECVWPNLPAGHRLTCSQHLNPSVCQCPDSSRGALPHTRMHFEFRLDSPERGDQGYTVVGSVAWLMGEFAEPAKFKSACEAMAKQLTNGHRQRYPQATTTS